MNIVLHTGLEHPTIGWLFVTAIASFVVGTGFGVYLHRRNRRVESSMAVQPNDH